jgi:hypothetical protein
MSEATKPAAVPSTPADAGDPRKILLVAYPKIIFLYPAMLTAVIAGMVMWFVGQAHWGSSTAFIVSAAFMGILAVNLVVLAFDFPRTTSLTLFFFLMAVLLGLMLLFKFRPDWFPLLTDLLKHYHPVANATFYWSIAGVLGTIFVCVLISTRFDYWEVRPNELLHHHGVLSNLERWSAPNLKIDKEINDVFEYFLLRSGRLILHSSQDRKAIILDNVPFIKKKEEQILRMLGALQVELRTDKNS